mmetsp:Transcript_15002/g.38536  ORF Transcript_15002/g.38536 Transcript_15002/m.38536 type:complete len:649 (-) Transcript_15002:139-2085(-)
MDEKAPLIAETSLSPPPTKENGYGAHHLRGADAGPLGSLEDDGTRGLVWDDVTVDVDTRAGTKRILDNCHGTCYPGQVTCIIGPSGAGKTTLFNTLCGKVPGVSAEARIRLDGFALDKYRARKHIAYVTQDDYIFATVTVREALLFSARLRLPAETAREEIDALVDRMITQLKLQKCADSLVGGPLIRGISGGERKRCSIGIELITQPGTIFLDEPTSGLDSFAALEVVRLLRKLADDGCTVLSVIHQPSSEIFAAFDKAILLAHGRTLYGGSTKKLLRHFGALGFECPPQYNPADFVLHIAQTESTDNLLRVQKAWEGSAHEVEAEEVKEVAHNKAWVSHSDALQHGGNRPGFVTQLTWLTRREFQRVLRDKKSLVARFGVAIFMNLFFAMIYLGVGTRGDDACYPVTPACAPLIRDHFGAITNLAISLMFGAAQPTLLAFPLERPTFLHEYGSGTYGVLPYFISKTISEGVLTFLQASVIFLLQWKLMELQGPIYYFIFAGFGLSMVAQSLALLLGCVVSAVKVAVELSPLVFVPQIVFSGLFIQVSQIPVWLRWAQYACCLKFAINLFMVIEFSGPACSPSAQITSGQNASTTQAIEDNWKETCRDFMESQDVYPEQWTTYAGTLAGLFFLFRIIAAFALRTKAS